VVVRLGGYIVNLSDFYSYGEWWKRKDGVEEDEEAGLVNKYIFWRSTGGNALEDRDMNS
jgi:hypothetical protein